MKNKKQTRRDFKNSVFKRDGFKCVFCNFGPFLENPEIYFDAHHITDRNEMPNGGYHESNGITLCKEECHIKAERFHITEGKEWEDGMHPDDLYEMIGSSKELAIKNSELL